MHLALIFCKHSHNFFNEVLSTTLTVNALLLTSKSKPSFKRLSKILKSFFFALTAGNLVFKMFFEFLIAFSISPVFSTLSGVLLLITSSLFFLNFSCSSKAISLLLFSYFKVFTFLSFINKFSFYNITF